jgi:hypothetical protein
MDAVTPAWSALRIAASDNEHRSRPTQVSLLRPLDLPTILSPTTVLPFPCPGFRTLLPPDRLPRLSLGRTSQGRWDRRRTVRGSPLARRLPGRLGRIGFVILRTGRSPPVALHLASRRRSYLRLQVRNVNLVGTCTPLIQRHRRRTSRSRQTSVDSSKESPNSGELGYGNTSRFGTTDFAILQI